MLETLQEPPPAAALPDGGRTRRRDGRLGKVLARRRPLIFAPLFVAALAFSVEEGTRPPVAVAAGACLTLALAAALRIWATGFRTWVRDSGGERHLMTAGPYAFVRHPLYLANGVAGAAGLLLLFRLETLALYVPLYAAVTAAIVAREEATLDERYGADHEVYSALVPRFVPRPWRRVAAADRAGEFSWRPVASGLELWKVAGLAIAIVLFLQWH